MAPQPQPARKGSPKLLTWSITLGLIAIVVPASVIVILVGMLPTLVAFMTDRTPKKYATFSVGALNLCGTLPSLIDLWSGQGGIGAAISIVADPLALIIMFGAASIGWMIYLVVPPVFTTMRSVVAEHRVAELRATQKELIQEWGAELAAGEDAEKDERIAEKGLTAAPPPATE